MSQQFLRKLSLVAADPNGKGLELGALRCVFEVKRGDSQTPNSCDVRVYNLSEATANQLMKSKNGVPEFTQLTLRAAYGDQPLAQIFWGSITQIRKGREDQKNSYVAITAADGDEPYNFSPTAFALAAGAIPAGPITQIIADMARFAFGNPQQTSQNGQPLSQGYTAPQFKNNNTRAVKGRTFYGNCKDVLRKIADQNDCRWSIQDGQVVFTPKTGYIPEPPVLITPATGLIGVPELTQTGLKVRVLLNPAIKIARTIKLQSNSVNTFRYGLGLGEGDTNLFLQQGAGKQNADGLYYVMRIDHNGDSRGAPWYTDLTCLAVDATVVPESTTAGAVISNVIYRY